MSVHTGLIADLETILGARQPGDAPAVCLQPVRHGGSDPARGADDEGILCHFSKLTLRAPIASARLWTISDLPLAVASYLQLQLADS